MSRKKGFLYDMEVEKENGEIARFSIYKSGRNIYIVTDKDYEHIMHPSAKTVEDEIRIVFNAKVIRKIHPWNDKPRMERDANVKRDNGSIRFF